MHGGQDGERGLRLCIISSKECWQSDQGAWMSYGGFPLQMSAFASLFDECDLLVVRSTPRSGALPLPSASNVVALPEPAGQGLRRKLDVLVKAPAYLEVFVKHIRRADVVHVPVPGDLPLLALIAALAMMKPVIARYGGSWESTAITTISNRITRALMRFAAGGQNLMLATGDAATPPASRMQWIFSTALTRDEMATIEPKFDRALNNPPRLIYAGRLSTEKGVDTLIHAISLLRREPNPLPVFVTLAGDGPERKSLEMLAAELGCGEAVRFAGQVDRSELSALLSEADFAVQPSRTEGLSKAWLDEMAHGLPVVGSAVGAASAVIGGDGLRGWLVPPGAPEALADAIRNAVQTPREWPALRRRCRQYAESKTVESWAEEIGRRCAERWQCSFKQGKLRAAEH